MEPSDPFLKAIRVLQKDSVLLQPFETLSARSLSRRATLQRLVNRFYWQIRYGCQNPSCSTPTCHSCRRRVAKGPLRPFTTLSAKALAAFLAEQENPEQALCPHPPAWPASGSSECQAATISQKRDKSSNGQRTNQTDAQNLNGLKDNPSQVKKPSSTDDPPSKPDIPEKRQKKDFKSITQSLFDTETWWVLQSISHERGKFVWTGLPTCEDWQEDGKKSQLAQSSSLQSRSKTPQSSALSSTNIGDEGPDTLQVLSHFSPSNVSALVEIVQSLDRGLTEKENLIKWLGISKPSYFYTPLSRQARSWYRFAHQSMVHIFSSVNLLLTSFLDSRNMSGESRHKKSRCSLDCAQIEDCIRNLKSIEGFPQRIFPSLWVALGHAFASHSELKARRSQLHDESHGNAPPMTAPAALSGPEAAHVVGIVVAALNASVPVRGVLQNDFFHFRIYSSNGHSAPDKKPIGHRVHQKGAFFLLQDAFEDDGAMDLATRMVRVWMVRRAIEKFETFTKPELMLTASSAGFAIPLAKFVSSPSTYGENVISEQRWNKFDTVRGDEHDLQGLLLIEWLRHVIFRYWDGKADVEKTSPVAGAIDWLSVLHKNKRNLQLTAAAFLIWRFDDKLDPVETAVAWELSEDATDKISLLSFPFLFWQTSWIVYFRAINHASMRRAVEQSAATARLMVNMASTFQGPDHRLLDRMKPVINTFLVLDIRRDNILTDALNQLWRRDRRELKRPLRVRLGMEEGEQGVDYGGIQQEFFRLAMAEAFDPAYGLFTTDSVSKMSWFQPGSLEPLYKYELLGLLASLAVYNGLTLPFTFPKVLYMKLLNVPFTDIWEIVDGWPELTRGLMTLSAWNGDDVEQIFMRSFAFEAPMPGGRTFSMDLSLLCKDGQAPDIDEDYLPPEILQCKVDDRRRNDGSAPTASDSGPSMVTSKNKEAFVAAYIKALIHVSIAPQFDAFRRGFQTVLSPKSLSLFGPDPATLKTLVEGEPASNTTAAELKHYCTYESGFGPHSDAVVFFWDVVENEYDTEMLGKLLEFVTSSARVSIQGVVSMTFVLQRNGDDEARLPTSMTCFSRLLLPEYKSKDVLRERLRVALENSQGFGVA